MNKCIIRWRQRRRIWVLTLGIDCYLHPHCSSLLHLHVMSASTVYMPLVNPFVFPQMRQWAILCCVSEKVKRLCRRHLLGDGGLMMYFTMMMRDDGRMRVVAGRLKMGRTCSYCDWITSN